MVSAGERNSEDNGEPVKGGTLVYGLEADSANPWAPYRTSCARAAAPCFKAISDPLFSEDPDGTPVGYLRRVGRAQRRLHRVDAEDPRRHQVPRRLAARWRGRQVQHRVVPVQPVDRILVRHDRQGHRVGPGRRHHHEGPVGRAADGISGLRPVFVHVLSDLARQPRRRTAAHRYDAGVRRHVGRDTGRWRSGQTGRARRVHVRVVHARQRQRVQIGP